MNIAQKIRRANIEIHSRESAIYDAIHSEIFGQYEQNRISRELDLIASIMPKDSVVRVLDIGCGTGNLTLKFLERGYFVKATDISPEMIRILQSKLSPEVSDRIELVIADAEAIITDTRTQGKWDVISFSSVLHHLPDYEYVLVEAMQQLRPGGILYVCHEPLRKLAASSWFSADNFFNTMEIPYIYVHKLAVYMVHSLRNRSVFKRIDYSWSDYHSRRGIDAKKMLQDLECMGGKTLLYETYRSRYSSLLARLDNYFAISKHSHFRFVVQR